MAWTAIALAACIALSACSPPGATATSAPPIPSPATGSGSPSDGCPVGRDDSDVAFRDPAGTCLPLGRAVAYRCDPRMPPVVALDSGTPSPQRYLGGSFAVPTDLQPEGAARLGSGSGMELFDVTRHPRLLYVRQRGVVSRWTALPTSDPLGDGRTVLVIGDSIALGAAQALIDALPSWSVTVDAENGRGSSGGVAPALAAASATPPPDVVVVELGTNDANPESFRDNADTILAALHETPMVVWQTAHSPDENIPSVNAAIRGEVARRPNATIADWDGFVTDQELSSDGIHPLSENEHLMADLVAPLLRTWAHATLSGGPLACLEAAESP